MGSGAHGAGPAVWAVVAWAAVAWVVVAWEGGVMGGGGVGWGARSNKVLTRRGGSGGRRATRWAIYIYIYI